MKCNIIHKKKVGFTLIELMIVIAIMSFILAVVLFNYRTFNNRLAVTSNAQEMAIAVRQTQTYGLSVKEVTKGGGDFSTGYGIYFSIDTPGSYYIFADTNHNGLYDGDLACSSGTECVQKVDFRNGVTINSICGTETGKSEECPPPGRNGFHIVFVRPNPDALIQFTNNAGQSNGKSYDSARVVLNVLNSPSNIQSSVSIDVTGRVSIQ